METVSIPSEMDADGIGKTQMVAVIMIRMISPLMTNAALASTD